MTLRFLSRLCVVMAALLSLVSASAQPTNPATPGTELSWQEMIQDPSISFFEIQDKFNQYWADRPMEKGKGFKAFKRWEHFMAPRVNPTTGEWPDPMAVWNAQQDQPEMFGMNENMPGDWTYIGNTSVPSGGGAGRVNCVRPLPGSTTTWFACAPGGGLWKTTNSGTSWTMVGTDFLSSIGCSDVAIDPGNTNIMYLATGDGDAGDTYSLGVLKSTDAGATWNTTGLNWNVTQSRVCSRIIINPNNTQQLICATSNGIWRTTDAGANWTQEIAGDFNEVMFKPGDPTIVYAVTDQFYRSTDTGDNWTNITAGLPTAANTQRMAIGLTDANTAYVYILASNNSSGFLGVYRATDSGLNFTTRATTPNLLGWATDGSDSGGQGWYDLCITVDPTNAETIWTGGVNVWKSTNGGTNYTLNGHWYGGGGAPYVHADNHFMGFVGTRLTIGNDGGVFTTTNGGTNWTDNSSNLPISQQYKLGVAALNSNIVLTGWQDNGTNRKNGAAWAEVIGGDGMECIIDHTNSNIMYGTIYYGQIYKSTNGGASFGTIVGSGGANEDENGAWVTPFILGTNANHIFVGKSRVYKSTDGGTVFTASAAFGSGNCNDMTIAPSDNNILFASKGGSLFKSTDNAATFSAVGTGLPGNSITDIAVHNTDPTKVWVTVSNYTPGAKVYYSTDGGANFTNISGTLPNVPANAIVYQHGSNGGIYVGMEAGVFYRDNDLGAWVPYMNLLPMVQISELEIHYATSTITAATYGRGLWRAPLYALPNLDAVLTQVNSPTGSSCNMVITPQIDVLNAGTSTITAMNIQYQVVGQAVQNLPWTGSLASLATTTITLPNLNYGAGSFVINFNITTVNGGADDNMTNNTGTSSYVTINGTNNATLTLITDCYPTETSWQITDGTATVIHSGSGYPGNTTNTIPLCLPDDCFTFTIFDSYGDGLNGLPFGCPFNGNYTITDDATSTVLVAMTAPGGDFDFQASHNFCFPIGVVLGCTNVTACNYNAAATQDDGSCTFGPANDLCANAITVVVNAAAIAVDNTTCCLNGPNPTCGNQTGQTMKDLWYKFVYSGGPVTITTNLAGVTLDTRLAVYSACGGSQLACNDDVSGDLQSTITFACGVLTVGNTYYIQAGGYSSLSGSFQLQITAPVETCNDLDDDCDGQIDEGIPTNTYYRDLDGDTYGNPLVTIQDCSQPAGYVSDNTDCNDNNASVNPSATEVCNNIDDDCDTLIDEGFDVDGDTYTTCEGDCNDNNASIHPGATEVCNNVDDDCDGSTDEGFDVDGDTYTTCEGDCNDNNASVHPGATEVCNNIDDDCDGSTDEGFDVDGDTYTTCEGDCNDNNASIHPGATEACNNIDEDCDGSTDEGFDVDGDTYTTCEGDCNDNNASVHPGATEVCNNIDDDCDGSTDEGFDVDGDTYTTCEGDCNDNNASIHPGAIEVCNNIDDDCDSSIDEGFDVDGDTYTTCEGDCNDNNASIHPGATEVCNNIDDDCDGSTDEGFDLDNDGFTTCEGDCNDNNANIFPGAPEACNGVDDDCDTFIDESVSFQNYYTDADGDGYGSTLIGNFCSPPANSSLNNLDCNDGNAAINPNATEICNNIDDDCDGSTDEGFDVDGDTYTTCEGDCNDNNASIHPGATEVCNNIDDDCDGSTDEGFDVDGDTYTTCEGDCNDNNASIHPGATEVCNNIDDDCDSSVDEGFDVDGDTYTTCEGDCNDNNAAINPGAVEICNGLDDDCDGSTDEGVAQTWYLNADGDAYYAASQVACSAPSAGWTNVNPGFGGDCNDSNAAVNPGMTEQCGNGIDDNCNGTADEGCGGGGGGNDSMAGAQPISANGNVYPSCNILNGTCVGATASPEGNPANVITGEDRWYKFTAISPGVRITVNTSEFNSVIELHNNLGAEINAEDMTGFGGSEILNYSGLTEGAQYFVAVRNYNSALGNGAFNICLQALMDSRCDDGPGNYVLCSNFKADWTGANIYQFNFTPSGGGATTSASSTSQVSLSNSSLGLQYSANYLSTIDAIYYLADGAGNPETIVIVGNEVCAINIGPHPDEQVKVGQRCPAILPKSTVLQAKPFVCGAIQHRFEFTQVNDFGLPLGLPFTVLTTGSSSTLGLWFVSPQSLINGAKYNVRVQPIFSFGPGIYGTPQCIMISPTIMPEESYEVTDYSERNAKGLQALIYPNPTDGSNVMLNIETSEDGMAHIAIMDAMGRKLHSETLMVKEYLNTSVHFSTPLSAGIYFVEVVMNDQRIVQRLVVEK
ncbi:MAG: MopE-related protein [Flavobacteriales bacterium]